MGDMSCLQHVDQPPGPELILGVGAERYMGLKITIVSPERIVYVDRTVEKLLICQQS